MNTHKRTPNEKNKRKRETTAQLNMRNVAKLTCLIVACRYAKIPLNEWKSKEEKKFNAKQMKRMNDNGVESCTHIIQILKIDDTMTLCK